MDLAELQDIMSHVPKDMFEAGYNPFTHWKKDIRELNEWRIQMEVAVDKIVDAYSRVCARCTHPCIAEMPASPRSLLVMHP